MLFCSCMCTPIYLSGPPGGDCNKNLAHVNADSYIFMTFDFTDQVDVNSAERAADIADKLLDRGVISPVTRRGETPNIKPGKVALYLRIYLSWENSFCIPSGK